MCFNLMKYIVRNYRFDDESETFAGEVGRVWERLMADWEQFVEQPDKLLKVELDRKHLPVPTECPRA